MNGRRQEWASPVLALAMMTSVHCASSPAPRKEELEIPSEPNVPAKATASASASPDAAALYEQGVAQMKVAGGKAAIAHAADLFDRACEAGDMRACVELGELLDRDDLEGHDPKRAVALYDRACSRGFGDGCTMLGFAYLDEDRQRGLDLLVKACKAGSKGGCFNLILIGCDGADAKRSAEIFQIACDGGLAIGCLDLGQAYVLGEGVPKDARRGAELIDLACKSADAPDTCDEIVNHHR